MISSHHATSASLRKAFTARVGSGGSIKTYYAQNGGVGSSLTALESSWLVAQGGTGNGLNTLWGTYLASKGFNAGGLKDRIKAFFISGTP